MTEQQLNALLLLDPNATVGDAIVCEQAGILTPNAAEKIGKKSEYEIKTIGQRIANREFLELKYKTA